MTISYFKDILSHLRALTSGTQWEGHLLCVGGCCRDMLLGREIKDIDMVVDIPRGGILFVRWLDEEGLLGGKAELFEEFGTTKFHLAAFPETELECVNTRREYYPDHDTRNPVTSFGTLMEDCMRRDLTVNSLYIRVSDSEVVDPCGQGLQDIASRTIRCTAPPRKSLYEDPLRILRTARFAARLGWDIEPDTYGAMCDLHPRLRILTPARIRGEVEGILTDCDPVRGLSILRDAGALGEIFPTLGSGEGRERWDESLRLIGNLPPGDPETMWTAFLRQMGDVGSVIGTLTRMGCPPAMRAKVGFLIGEMDSLPRRLPVIAKDLRALQARCRDRGTFDALMDLGIAMGKGGSDCGETEACCREMLRLTRRMEEEGSALFPYRPPLDGDEIMHLAGIGPGRKVRECMDYLFTLSCENPLRSREEFEAALLDAYPSL